MDSKEEIAKMIQMNKSYPLFAMTRSSKVLEHKYGLTLVRMIQIDCYSEEEEAKEQFQ